MKMGWFRRAAGVVFLGAFLVLAGGCGYKNAPVPPAHVVPVAISDLLYKLDDKGVQLTWSYPVETLKGTTLDDISSFDLYMAEISLDDYCPSCPIPFGEPMEIAGGSPVDGKVRRTTGYESTLLRSGYKYFFKVRSRTSWWADSADSNIVTFVWFQPAAAPTGVTATPGDQQVVLKWQPVTTFKDGSAVAFEMDMKYQVRRSSDGKNFEQLGEPVTATQYADNQVRNGSEYFYTVQSIMVINGEFVSGQISRGVAATPVDLVSPFAPTGVTVVKTGVGTKVFWERSDADDLGGYRVYRRAANRKDFEMVGLVEPEYTLFVDAGASESEQYYYAVTAIDRETPPNESAQSEEATSRY
ncbi:MAG: hypothetical protein WBB19_07940 [Desulforhopalus sp.]